MADEKKPEDSAKPEQSNDDLPRAKVGVKDKGKIVYTALDQPMSGAIADVADGDD
jgi:hypothetical protein